jgi:hypothetical protein
MLEQQTQIKIKPIIRVALLAKLIAALNNKLKIIKGNSDIIKDLIIKLIAYKY